jgi:hypothetical protein
MNMWRRGYEQIPDIRTVEKELGESRKHTSPLWKYLAIGAIPTLICGILALAIFAGVLSLGLVILHERCPPAVIPVARTYVVGLEVNQTKLDWSTRATVITALESYLHSIASKQGLVYLQANNPLSVRFNHAQTQSYVRIFNEIYLDTPDHLIAAAGASLRMRSFLSSSGNGPSVAGTAILQYIFRSGDVTLATDAAIGPAASQAGSATQSLQYVFTYVPEYTSSVTRYEHRVGVPYQFIPSSVATLNLLFSGLSNVLPQVSSNAPLNVTSSTFVWEQIYSSDGIGPTNVLYPQILETNYQFVYSTQTGAITGTGVPNNASVTFRMLMGNDGYGRWDTSTLDQATTLFQVVSSSSWSNFTTPAMS